MAPSSRATEQAPLLAPRQILIPPKLVATPAGEMLAVRVLRKHWISWSQSDLPTEREVPPAVLLDMQHRLGKKRGPGEVRCCVVCKEPSRQKCSCCLATHYCSRVCQTAHWDEHRATCSPPEPQVERHVALALPDFACSWEYVQWIEAQPSTHFSVGVCVLNQQTYRDQFGDEAADRAMLHLALKGRPALYQCAVTSPKQQGSATEHAVFHSEMKSIATEHAMQDPVRFCSGRT